MNFPGEIEDLFEELLDFILEQNFDRVGCFTYSHQKGTTSFQLNETVDEKSEESELLLQGRISCQAPDIDGVVLINASQAQTGEFVQVKITDSHDYDLIGHIVDKIF